MREFPYECVWFQPNAMEVFPCGKPKGHAGFCGGEAEGYPEWRSVFVEEETLFGWRRKSIFGAAINPTRCSCSELDHCWGLRGLVFRLQKTKHDYPIRVVDRFWEVLWAK